MAQILLDYPFLLTLVAGFVAGLSAILARRAAPALGRGLQWLAGFLSSCAALAFIGSFLWAWGWTGMRSLPGIVTSLATYAVPARAPSPFDVAVMAFGWLIVAAGAALVAWAAAARVREAIYRLPASRVGQTPPYTRVRRPMALGFMAIALGGSVLTGTTSTWICYGIWLVMTQILLELADWEAGSRLPARREYLRQTPRYLPLRRKRQSVPGGDSARSA